jgi:hypothetical protein
LNKAALHAVSPSKLKRGLRSVCILDIILFPKLESRIFFYYRGILNCVDLAKVDTGEGDHVEVLFAPEGTLIKGLAHESDLSPWSDELVGFDLAKVRPELLDHVPSTLGKYLGLKELLVAETTFVVWRTSDAGTWTMGRAKESEGIYDGSDDLLNVILVDAAEYQRWFLDDSNRELSLSALSEAFTPNPNISGLIRSLGRGDRESEIIGELRTNQLL